MKRTAILGALAGWLCFFAAGLEAASVLDRFTDDSGRDLVIKRPYRRIISLYPAHTENLFALGLDKEIIGVGQNEFFPPAAATKPAFSYRDDVERFLAAGPDLVLIRPMIHDGYRGLVDQLAGAGVAVASLQPKTPEEMHEYWRKLGRLTGRPEAAEALLAAFQTRLAGLEARVDPAVRSGRPRVFFESIHRQMKTFAPSSMAVFALNKAGGLNAAPDAAAVRDTNIADYGLERLLARGDRIDVYLAQQGTMNKVTVPEIMNEAGFQAIKAVRRGRVHLIHEALVSRPTPRLLDGVYEIGRILFPEVFNDLGDLEAKKFLTRAELAELLVKALDLPLLNLEFKPDGSGVGLGLADVDYFRPEARFIETAAVAGLIQPRSLQRFEPSAPARRDELARALVTHFKPPEAGAVLPPDVDPGHPWLESLRRAASLGLLPLDEEGRFGPEKAISGREACSALTTVFRIMGKKHD
ncbi:MAG: ABC transporter substrate-binding protein [Thermodesulfobacteriota bacterium]